MEKERYNTSERLQISMEIITNLKNYKMKNGKAIDLYNENLCKFVKELKGLINSYIRGDSGFNGKISFDEINKTIEYNLPLYKNEQPLFVIRM